MKTTIRSIVTRAIALAFAFIAGTSLATTKTWNPVNSGNEFSHMSVDFTNFDGNHTDQKQRGFAFQTFFASGSTASAQLFKVTGASNTITIGTESDGKLYLEVWANGKNPATKRVTTESPVITQAGVHTFVVLLRRGLASENQKRCVRVFMDGSAILEQVQTDSEDAGKFAGNPLTAVEFGDSSKTGNFFTARMTTLENAPASVDDDEDTIKTLLEDAAAFYPTTWGNIGTAFGGVATAQDGKFAKTPYTVNFAANDNIINTGIGNEGKVKITSVKLMIRITNDQIPTSVTLTQGSKSITSTSKTDGTGLNLYSNTRTVLATRGFAQFDFDSEETFNTSENISLDFNGASGHSVMKAPNSVMGTGTWSPVIEFAGVYTKGADPTAEIGGGDLTITSLEANEAFTGVADGTDVIANINGNATITFDKATRFAGIRFMIAEDAILTIKGTADPADIAKYTFKGRVIREWLAMKKVINLNFCSGNNKFADGDTSVDGLLAGNTPKSSWINLTSKDATSIATGWDAGKQEAFAISGMSVSAVGGTLYGGGVSSIPVLKTYIDESGADGNKVVITGIPFEMYDIIVYLDNDTNNTIPFHPIHVNGVAYTWDATNSKTVIGKDTDYWGHRQSSGVTCGVNALCIPDLANGDITIITGQRNNSVARGAISAIQIVEVEKKEFKNVYTTTDASDVKISEINAYVASGPAYAGAVTVNLKGGDLIFDAAFGYAALTVNSTGDVTIKSDGVYAAGTADFDKIALGDITGEITWKIPVSALATSEKGCSYAYDTGTADSPVALTLNVANGKMTLKDATFYLGTTYNATKSYVDMVNATVYAKASDGLGVGMADFTLSGTTKLTTEKVILSQGGGNRTASLTLNDTAEIIVTGATIADQNTSSLMFGHWNGPTTFTLNDSAKFTAENAQVLVGKTGLDQVININGGTFTAKGIKASGSASGTNAINLNGGELKLGEYGITSYNASRTLPITVNGDTKITATASELPISQAITINSGKTLTIDVGEGKTARITGAISGAGNIIKTGAGKIVLDGSRAAYTGTITIAGGTYDIGKTRDYAEIGNIVTSGTGIITATANTADDCLVTIVNVPDGTSLTIYDVDGTTILATTKVGTTITAACSVEVSGKACWMDYEFDGNLSSVGTDTTGLSRDGSDFGADATNDFRNASELYTGTHPWRNITYPTEWTCAIYGSIPEYGEAALICFGTNGGGLIGLIKGPNATDDQVLLVRTTGNSKYEVLADMSVPNATTAQHLYAFVKTARTIEIYLDGKHWKTYNADAEITFGGGIQIASVHGGVGLTGIVRFDYKLFDSDNTNETLRKSVIGMMRLYDCVLGPNAMAKLASEFQYVSPNGLFTRTFADGEAAAWNETGKWTKVLEGGSAVADVPDTGAMIQLATGDEAATLAINLDAAATTEAVEISGKGALTIALAEGKAGLSNSGSTTIAAPVTIKYGALSITGGPTTIEQGGSVVFDYSAAPADFFQLGYTALTGEIAEQGENVVTAILPTPAKSYLAYSFGYNSAEQSYGITVSINREPTMLYLTENTTINDDTLFATTADGEADMPRLFADDVVFVPAGVTMTIPTTALAVPLGTIKGAGTISAGTDAAGFTLKNSAPLFTLDETWTGAVELTNIIMTGDAAGETWFDLNAYGNENSTVKLTSARGYMRTNTEFKPAVTIANSNLAGIEINNGSSNNPIIFRKVCGNGNFIANESGNTAAQKIAIGDASGLTGQIWMRNNKGITLGSTTSAAANNEIVVADGATISFAGQQWNITGSEQNPGGVAFGDNLLIIGEVGSYIAMSEPTALPTTVKIVGDDADYKLVYANGRLTVAHADIEVAIPEVTGATVAVEGYTIESGKIVVPYGASFTVVYTANEGKLFTDGEATKSFEFTNVTEVPEIKVEGLETTAAEPTATVEQMEEIPESLADAATFTAGEESKLYADWNADFLFSADQDIPQGVITLKGLVDDEWVPLEFTGDYTADTKISVLDMVPDIGGWKMTYPALVQMQNFSCGLAVGKLLKTTNVTIDLVLTKDGEDAKTLATYETTILPTVVEVTIPEIANTTVAVTGGTLVGTTATVPYGAALTVTYTLEENYIFSDGTTAAKVFEFENVTEAPEIDVSDIKTVKVSPDTPTTGDVKVYADETGSELVLAATGDGYTGEDVRLSQSIANYTEVKSVVIGAGVKHIGNRYFKDFTGLTTVKGGKDLVKFEEKAFYRCMSLEKIELENPAALDSLKDAVVYQMAINEKGEFFMIPSIQVSGYTENLYGKKSLDTKSNEWELIGPLAGQNLKELKEDSPYHFFRTQLDSDTAE